MKKTIVISADFLSKMQEFDRKNVRSIMVAINKLNESFQSNSLKAHRLNQDCDSRFFSIRVNMDLRVILVNEGDNLILLYVDHHDDAYNWAKGKHLKNNYFNSSFIYNENVEFSENERKQNSISSKSVFKGTELKSKHLVDFGLSEDHAELVMGISDIEYLLKFISFLPDEIQEGIIDIALKNKSVEAVYRDLTSDSHFESLTDPNSRRRFINLETTEQDELERLFFNFEEWKFFLHPKQKVLVERFYNGPVLVEGGPGTGKSVIGVHRIKYLAETLYPDSTQLFFFTFNKNLAQVMKNKMYSLIDDKLIQKRIEVTHVDKFIHKLLVNSGVYLSKYDSNMIRQFIDAKYREFDFVLSVDFLTKEYFEVIQKNQIKSLEDYLLVKRKKQNSKLYENQRKQLWAFFALILEYKQSIKCYDFDDRASLLISLVEDGRIKPCIDSMVIDEAQDLSAIKIKALSKLVKNTKNNIFMLSDKNQRIYSLFSWKGETGLRIKGRTYYLTLNYRTTREIKEFADFQYFINAKAEVYEREYKSLLSGPEPYEEFYKSTDLLLDDVEKIIRQSLKNVKPENIAVISNKKNLTFIEGFLRARNISIVNFSSIEDVNELMNKVNLVDANLVKGLEYRVVILAAFPFYNESINSSENDFYNFLYEHQYECLKYVVLTRARDTLYILSLEE